MQGRAQHLCLETVLELEGNVEFDVKAAGQSLPTLLDERLLWLFRELCQHGLRDMLLDLHL